MIAIITLKGVGLELNDEEVFQKIDKLCDILSETYNNVGFSRNSHDSIICKFDSVAGAEDILECVLSKSCQSEEVSDFLTSKDLQFEKIEFDIA